MAIQFSKCKFHEYLKNIEYCTCVNASLASLAKFGTWATASLASLAKFGTWATAILAILASVSLII
jgi:hypothetical protein